MSKKKFKIGSLMAAPIYLSLAQSAGSAVQGAGTDITKMAGVAASVPAATMIGAGVAGMTASLYDKAFAGLMPPARKRRK